MQLMPYEDYIEATTNIVRNRSACYEFLTRVNRLYGVKVAFRTDGKPAMVASYPHGPVWCVLVHKKPLPIAIVDEWKALVMQGLRHRQRLLGAYPEMNRDAVFPGVLKR